MSDMEKMMDIARFTGHMRDLDRRNGSERSRMFECEVRRVDYDTFAYTFDALVPVYVRFLPGGQIIEWCDVDESELTALTPHHRHDSVETWLNMAHQRVQVPHDL